MANKKKIQERLEAEQKARQTRYIQIAGAAVVVLIIALGLVYAVNNKPAEEAPQDAVPTPVVEDSSSVVEDVPAAEPSIKQYDAYPPMTIDTSKKYFAKFVLAKGGEFTVELYADKAPKTVNSFVFLARDGYFDGVTFHRVIDGFMAQGGDPTGRGDGGPGYYFEYEPNDLKFDKAGVVAMANTGPATPTNGSQFFITFDAAAFLDGGYTIFGQVTEGMDVVNGITRRDPQQNPNFTGDVIKSITITEE